MTCCVLDSSVALAWVLPGEGTEATEALLDQVASAGAIAPALWPLETANLLLMAERRGRVTLAERQRALLTLAELAIRIDLQTAGQAWGDTLSLAATYGLTLYDATYLELAVRLALPLASLDEELCRAGAASGIVLIGR